MLSPIASVTSQTTPDSSGLSMRPTVDTSLRSSVKSSTIGSARRASNASTIKSQVTNNTTDAIEAEAEGCLALIGCVKSEEGQGEVMCMHFSPDSNFLAAGLKDSSITIYNASNKCVNRLLTSNSKTSNTQDSGDRSQLRNMPVTSVHFFNNSKVVVATYTTGHVRFWRVDSVTCVLSLSEGRPSEETLNLGVSPSENLFATTGADTQILLYDTERYKCVNKFNASDSREKMDGHRSRVFTIKFIDENVMLTGGWDDTIQFWDVRCPPFAFRRIFGPHICGDALDFNADRNEILTGSWRKTDSLEIWDYASGEKVVGVDDHSFSSQLYCAKYFGTDTLLCAGGSENLARLIDRNTLNTIGGLRRLDASVFSLTTDMPTSRIAFASSDKIYFTRLQNKTKAGFGLLQPQQLQ